MLRLKKVTILAYILGSLTTYCVCLGKSVPVSYLLRLDVQGATSGVAVFTWVVVAFGTKTCFAPTLV